MAGRRRILTAIRRPASSAMPFDVEAAQREFRRLDRTGGEIRTDRVPKREDEFCIRDLALECAIRRGGGLPWRLNRFILRPGTP